MMIKVKCPCETDDRACCACISMHCDECHDHSKFEQGNFCSHCGRPLKAELKRNYVSESEAATELLDEIIHVLDETSLAYQHGMSMKGIRTKGKTILYGKYEACSQFMSYLINLKNKYTSRGD